MDVNPRYPGPKQAGPDGERYRIKDPAFFDLTLKYCLNCKRCEVACPSGVKIGDIIQTARLRYGRQNHPVRDFTLASTDLVGRIAVPFAPLVNGLLSVKPVKKAAELLVGIHSQRTFPEYSGYTFDSWMRRQTASQLGYSRFVGYFHGCYVNYNYPQLGKDLVRLVNACGYGVRAIEKELCCGVALMSNGFEGRLRQNAEHNVEAFRKAMGAGCEAVLTSSSTCTFTMRDEYEHVLGIDNSAVRDSLLLAVKWLYDKVEDGSVKLHFRKDFRMKAAYHTACHMDKLGWGIYSMSLLRMIPGLELCELDHNCCGIAGTFGFKKENYDFSQKIGEKLFAGIRESGCDVVVTDCETCKWQIEMSTGVKVMNPVSILAEAIDTEMMKCNL